DASAAPDHLADVVRGHVQVEDERAVALLALHMHCTGVVDELAREIREKLGHGQCPFQQQAVRLWRSTSPSCGVLSRPNMPAYWASLRPCLTTSCCRQRRRPTTGRGTRKGPWP